MVFAPLVYLQRLAYDHEVDLGAFAFSRAEPRGGSGHSQKLAAVNSLYDSFRHFSSIRQFRHFTTFFDWRGNPLQAAASFIRYLASTPV